MADPVATSPPGAKPPRFGRRFSVAYAALAVCFWATIAVGTIFVVRGVGGDHAAWSAWRPTGSGFDAAQQIAKHVGAEYRVDDVGGGPLVFVHPQDVDATQLAGFIWRSASEELPSRRTLVYELCGAATSPNCAIEGVPSDAREELIRREALELILYSYKYVKGYDSVVAFLPPAESAPKQLRVVLFRRDDLKQELRRPLRQTLATSHRVTPSSLTTIDESTVDELTAPHFFNAKPVALPSGSSFLELTPVG